MARPVNREPTARREPRLEFPPSGGKDVKMRELSVRVSQIVTTSMGWWPMLVVTAGGIT